MTWRNHHTEWREKVTSFYAHALTGFLIAAVGPTIPWSWQWAREPILWFLASAAVGYAWERGYWWWNQRRGPGPRIEFRERGWPKLDPTWDVYTCGQAFLPGDLQSLMYTLTECPDRRRPCRLDYVFFPLGGLLGLAFTIWIESLKAGH